MRRLLSLLPCAIVLLSARADDGLGAARRILFLGDSITHAGGYVETFEWFLQTQFPGRESTVINCGLPSETVSGLSEAGHAGGAFPRPDLHERLKRVVKLVQPDLVFACYGMNDGIYLPLNPERFTKFQDGMLRLHSLGKLGIPVVHLTPAVFDPVPIRNQVIADPFAVKDGQMFAGYDEVLDRYSRWLLEQRDDHWRVIDTHGAMKAALAEHRKTEPMFSFAADGVHPNQAGHLVLATTLIRAVDPLKGPAFIEWMGSAGAQTEASKEIRRLIGERSSLLRDAYLSAAGHKRPGMSKGLPIDEAKAKAAEIGRRIAEISAAVR